ncbi:pentapeptide repeat-containing protein [Actinorhabdospora filicis]|nr:pentapeptide repeat-containing protein [Actinorhabdospora filicis]
MSGGVVSRWLTVGTMSIAMSISTFGSAFASAPMRFVGLPMGPPGEMRTCDLSETADHGGEDLSFCDLAGYSLSKMDLREADLTGASLEGSHAFDAAFAGAVLFAVNAREADLTAADLTGADLRLADLRGATVTGVRCEGARLEQAMLPAEWPCPA